jgi:SAM-dependent methyltransferase
MNDLDISDLRRLAGDTDRIIVVDGERWRTTELFAGLTTVPFLENAGIYDGLPADSDVAIQELERLRAKGATAIAFPWASFWWFESYRGLHEHLAAHYTCLLENESMVVFSLREARSAGATAPRFITYAGYGDLYDTCRPHAPQVLFDVLTGLARERVRCVVDLGCGTGLSTRAWSEYADEVIGIEADAEMIASARAANTAESIRFVHAPAQSTGLAAGLADIVTCSQALHWMEPTATFAEVARLLRPGGVFCAYDNDWPPTTSSLAADEAYRTFEQQALALHGARGFPRPLSKAGHLARMRASGVFEHTKEVVCHGSERGHAARFIELARSQGFVSDLLEAGVAESETGLEALALVAQRELPTEEEPWVFSYRLRIGVTPQQS